LIKGITQFSKCNINHYCTQACSVKITKRESGNIDYITGEIKFCRRTQGLIHIIIIHIASRYICNTELWEIKINMRTHGFWLAKGAKRGDNYWHTEE